MFYFLLKCIYLLLHVCVSSCLPFKGEGKASLFIVLALLGKNFGLVNSSCHRAVIRPSLLKLDFLALLYEMCLILCGCTIRYHLSVRLHLLSFCISFSYRLGGASIKGGQRMDCYGDNMLVSSSVFKV